MGAYLISLLCAACVAALIGILSPDGEGGGIARHMRLLIALVLLCVLIAPMRDALDALIRFTNGDYTLPEADGGGTEEGYQQQMQAALTEASKTYVAQLLTQMLEREFSITPGAVRCAVRWSDSSQTLSPERITVILSQDAIWKDPAPIEDFVTALLGCECVTAVE